MNIKCFKEKLIKEENIIKEMFDMLRDNMMDVIPETFGDYNKDYNIFVNNCIISAIEEYKVKTIIAFNGEEVIGYLQYFYDNMSNELCIREIQISKKNQGDHETFRRLMKTMVTDEEFISISKIKGYINNNNEKSKNAFSKIGFKATCEKNNGKIYTSNKEVINKWLDKKLQP